MSAINRTEQHLPDIRGLGAPAGPSARPLLIALLVEKAAAVVDPVVVVAAAELEGERRSSNDS